MYSKKINTGLAIAIIGCFMLLNTVAEAAQDPSDCMTQALQNADSLAEGALKAVLEKNPQKTVGLSTEELEELQVFAYKTALTNLYNHCINK